MKILASWFTFVICISGVIGDDWPHFLGPYGDTSVREAGIRTEFPSSGFPLVWKQSVGGGYSGPAIANGRVFIMDRLARPYKPGKITGNPNFIRAAIPGKERIRALDADTGALIWEHTYDCPYGTVFTYAIGPRCTPTVEGRNVYTLGAEGDLICFDTANGDIHWSRQFKQDFNLNLPEWGCAAHPLVYKDLLVCMVGGPGSTVVAFDKRTGEERWRALSAEKPGYCPPTIANIHGVEQLLVWHGDGLASLDPYDGNLHWEVGVKPLYGMAIGAPRVHDEFLHIMGYNNVSTGIRVDAENRSAKVIWGPHPRLGVAGVLTTAHLDAEGYLYSAGGRREFYCVDIHDGKRLWETSIPLQNQRGKRPASWPSAFSFHHPPSGRTFLYNDHGELISTELSPEGYREISRARLMDPTHRVGGRQVLWSAPAFSNRRIYVRNDLEIRCYEMADNHPDARLSDALMEAQKGFIEDKDCLSNVFRLVRNGTTLYQHAMDSGVGGDPPIHEDTLFPIWSMTKPITSVAAMILYDRGLLQLDAPVSNALPRLDTFRVVSASDEQKTEPLKRPITYRDLLLHTSGIDGYDGSFDEEGTWKEVMELNDLDGLIDLLAGQPLKHQPGERYTYGLSTAVLGAAIEKLTGQSLEHFFKETLFHPLGMHDTKFHLTDEDRKRFQPLFVKTDEGFRLGTPAEDELYYHPDSHLFLGGEGLVSTLDDYGKFCQMLLDQGRAPDGHVILSQKTLEIMLRDQLGEIPGFGGSKDGYVMGFGFQVLQHPPDSNPVKASSGSYGWSGYHTTHFWIDPLRQEYGLFLTRLYPFNGHVLDQLREMVGQF